MPRIKPLPSKHALACLLSLFSAGALCQTATRQACRSYERYRVITLPFRPARINSSGLITGTTEDHQPAIWTEKDGVREIELPDGFSSAEPLAVNAQGAIVGAATRKDTGLPEAFLYSDGKFSVLSSNRSKASAISDSGLIAGEDSDRLAIWRDKKLTRVDDCCGGSVRAVNASGQFVGQMNDKSGHFHSFLSDSSKTLQTRSIDPKQDSNSSALAINDDGHILLQTFMPNAVYLVSNGSNTPLHLSAEFGGQPLALNNCDDVVGEFGAASDFNHAFLWTRKKGFRDLNKLVDPASGWNLESALDINDRGEIIGVGDHVNQQDVGFLLVPEAIAPERASRVKSK